MTHTDKLPAAVVDIIESNINPQFTPLLLAAVELLGALRETNRLLDELLDSDTAGISSDTGADIEEIQIGINTAILKAEGKA